MPIIKNLLALHKNTYLFLAVSWLCLITLASLVSVKVVQEVEHGIEVPDKLVHGVFYFVNTLLFFLYFNKSQIKNAIVKVSLFSFVYGIIIEVLQYVLPYERSFDLKDIIANSVGILTAIFLIKYALITRLR
ncbi:VanZ family protein [Galbibacter sp. PAP.153]|uniref:VanZ family protein n=1 Tax=Galbibacter sp. PAP.153 TaxID=3104623 RepID=UPI0030091B6C